MTGKIERVPCPHCGDRCVPIEAENGSIVEYQCVSGLHLSGVRFRLKNNETKEKGGRGG